MEKRWNVYHGQDYLGLKTAKEIREALRQGTLDPFDKVAREGSNIREDLIDVDEIFREDEEAAAHASSESAWPESTVVADRMPVLDAASLTVAVKAQTLQPKAKQTELPIEPQDSDSSESFSHRNETSTRNVAKRYYLLDRQKVLGPLSALEIQSLFNRNLLNHKVRVQKIGSEKNIPITQFIASYSGDRLKELAEDGRIPQQIGVGSPSSKVMNELARMANSRRVAQSRSNRTYLLIAAAGLILGALAYFLYEQSKEPQSNRPHSSENQPEETGPKSRPRLIQKTADPMPKKESLKKQELAEPPSPPQPTRPSNTDNQADETPSKPRLKLSPKASPKAPEPAPKKELPKKVEKPEPRRNPPVPRVAPSIPEPRHVDNNPPPAPAVPIPAPGPIAKALESVGRIQTIGPLTFSASALDTCPSKCTLTLFDATGASMKAVFFKNAYHDQLHTRMRGVHLTGNTKVEHGELTLFIQDVR